LTLTKIGSHVPVSTVSVENEPEKDRYEQAIRIRDAHNGSREIMTVDGSLMALLSNYAWYALRLYVLFPENDAVDKQRIIQEIGAAIRKYL
jgi:hypothetical protein